MLSSNHPSKHAPAEETLCIWIFHDGRPGHLSQLEGLANRISSKRACEVHWLDVSRYRISLLSLCKLKNMLKHRSKPDLILGAGHRTHWSVFFAGTLLDRFTCLVMKPSLPTQFFKAIICPKHDNLPDSEHVFTTEGPINKINPNVAVKPTSDRQLHLMLIGGESKHFMFDGDDILRQIKLLCQAFPERNWLIFNSPRTPADMTKALHQLSCENATFRNYKDKDSGKLSELLLETRSCWITPDSMSMIFEALSAKATVGLFNCSPASTRKQTRVSKQVQILLNNQTVLSFNDRLQVDQFNSKTLKWQADEAASWLLNAYSAWQKGQH